ncbi:hypothetical protein ACFV6B_39080 [Streptomyces microflavus]|uniref:hypothetical protein n=1 Tax=Streptomyces griseus group TaxID=629295 RepID=UPI00366135DA
MLLIVATLLGYAYLYTRMDDARAAGPGTSGLEAVCRRPPVFFPGNAAFREAGPYRMTVFQQQDQSFPRVWARADTGADRPDSQQDSAEVQLVACAERVQEERTRQVCRLESGETPLYRALYRVRIVEARTGQTVSDVVLRPSVEQCPRFVQLDPKDPRAYTLPSPRDYARRLAEWLE